MRAQMVPLAEVDDTLREQWRELARRSLEPNPFFEQEIVLNAAALPGAPEVALLIVGDANRLHLLAPVHRSRGYRRVPVPVLTTWDHDYSLLGTPLLGPEDPQAALTAALGFLRRERVAPWLVLEGMTAEGPVATALRTCLARERIRPSFLLPHTREALLDTAAHGESSSRYTGRTLRSLRRRRRQLAQELEGEVVTVDVTDGPDLDKAIEGFLRAEASGWKGTDGGAFLRRTGHADFFRAVCRDFAADGRLGMHVLGGPSTQVAFHVNLISQTRAFNFKIAYDDEYRQFSPGTLLELDWLDAFDKQSVLTSADSCLAWNAEPTHRTLPDDLGITTMLIPLSPVRGRAAARLAPAVRTTGQRLREWSRSMPERVPWKKKHH